MLQPGTYTPICFDRREVIMQSIAVRKEVQDFMQVSESLRSPAILTELTREECELIADQVMSLSHAKQPWSKSLITKYA